MKKTFTLLCASWLLVNTYSQVVLSESFDLTGLPAGWTQTTFASDGGWLTGNNYALGSSIFPLLEHGNFIASNDKCFCDKSNDFLKSPVMDLSPYSALWLKFDYSYVNIIPQLFTLEVSVDGGLSWDVFNTMGTSADGYWGWWETKYFDLSEYAGYDNVMIGFRYSDGGEWWSYGAAIDNFSVFQPLANDIALDSIIVSEHFVKTGTGITLNGVITNMGINTIHSFDAIWDDGTSTSTVTISALNIAQFEKTNFTHPIDFVPASAIPYTITLSALHPDGGIETDETNNALSTIAHGCSSKPHKNVVAELATGTWCSWCVRGHVYMDTMYELHPDNFIGIAVHDNDPMTVEEYDAALYAYQNHLSFEGGAAYPSIITDHKDYMDPIEMPYKMLPYMDMTVPLSVDVFGHYNDTTGIADIDVKTLFVTRLNPIDYRVDLIITEDSVTGTGFGWDQSNAYADGFAGVMGGFELLPSPVPASMMHYDHVARFIADGWYGAAGSLPTIVSDEDSFYHHYSIGLTDTWDLEKLNLIGMVIDQENGRIINAKSVKLSDLKYEEPADTSGTDTTEVSIINTQSLHIQLFPNPANTFSMLSLSVPGSTVLSLAVSDITGNILETGQYLLAEGENSLRINTASLSAGVYYVSLTLQNTVVTKKLTVFR